MSETILVVDDEEPVRRTFQEWLAGSGMDVRVLAAADAEAALRHASQTPIDLAILDWHLGSGSHGLQLLEDLSEFCPDVVAILVTGFAHQATPLDALRMGVRDYLDKNQDLSRESFLRAVRRQLEKIIPAKRQRAFHQSLAAFREAVSKIVPLAESASALNDPVPLPAAIGALFRFLLRATGAADGVLILRQIGDAEFYEAYGIDGTALPVTLAPFSRSLAASAVSLQEPVSTATPEAGVGVELQAFEQGRSSVLLAPLPIGPSIVGVMELFDKPGGFVGADRTLAQAAAEFGAEILRQAIADRQGRQLMLSAVASALDATSNLTTVASPEDPPPAAIMDRIRQGLNTALDPVIDPEATLEFAESLRVLAKRHGPAAVRYCAALIRQTREMLDTITGSS
jgi:ActR/RegA family two-component response regulator